MNLRQVRSKIKSVTNVKKITKAMQMVSAVKMRKAQTVALEGRPYNEHLEMIIRRIAQNISKENSSLLAVNEHTKKILIIFVSSNKGLAGSFHSSLDKLALKYVSGDVDYVTLGKKGAMFLGRIGGKVIADFSEGSPTANISAVFNLAVDKFIRGEYREVAIVYNKFLSTSRYDTRYDVLLPLTLSYIDQETQENKHQKEHFEGYIIEPDAKKIVDPLLRSFLESQIRSAVLSSEAVEHSARMIAMKNATDNATDVIYNLQLLGNKLRQGKITSELLDMVTAKESVENI